MIASTGNHTGIIEVKAHNTPELCPWESRDACKGCVIDCNNKKLKRAQLNGLLHKGDTDVNHCL